MLSAIQTSLVSIIAGDFQAVSAVAFPGLTPSGMFAGRLEFIKSGSSGFAKFNALLQNGGLLPNLPLTGHWISFGLVPRRL